MDPTLFHLDQIEWSSVGDGLRLAPLHVIDGDAGTAFLRFDRGAISGAHLHPAGEELYVISGRLRVGDQVLEPGDFLYTPPGGIHDAEAYEDTVTLISVPEAIQFV